MYVFRTSYNAEYSFPGGLNDFSQNLLPNEVRTESAECSIVVRDVRKQQQNYMIGLFVGVFLLTVSVATSGLFYLFPYKAVSSSPKVVMTASTLGIGSTPTPTVLVPTDSPSVFPTITPPIIPQITSSLSFPPSPSPVNLFPSSIPLTPTSSLTPPESPPSVRLSPSPQTPIPTSSSQLVSPTPTLQSIVQTTQNDGLNADVIFSLVNDFRKTNGLDALQKDDKVCSVAASRAPQVYSELFITHTPDAGLKQINFPYWITENIINNTNEQDAVDWWLHDPVHRQQILGNYSFSCVACSGYSCVQVFTNYIAK